MADIITNIIIGLLILLAIPFAILGWQLIVMLVKLGISESKDKRKK